MIISSHHYMMTCWDLIHESVSVFQPGFGKQVETVGKAPCCILYRGVPSREECSSKAQWSYQQVGTATRWGLMLGASIASRRYFSSVRETQMQILLQFHFKVTSCSTLSNQEYCNNTLIKWHSKYMDHNSNIFQSPEDYHGYNLTKAICTNSCLC